ncbi:MAG: alkaline phosphatase family protein [Clostridium paraputrificum]
MKPYQHQLFMSAGAGSLGFQLDINKRFGNLRKGIEQPYLDNFVIEAAKYTIKKYAPNLMLIHFTDVDTNRHHYGYSNKVIDDALLRHDSRLGEIIGALKERGIYDECTIVALGDHSHLDASKVIKLNALFRKEGLIKINEKGKVLDYKGICKSLDGSCYIYLKDKNDNKTIEKIKALLKSLPVDFILEGEEIGKSGGDMEASLMIEYQFRLLFC